MCFYPRVLPQLSFSPPRKDVDEEHNTSGGIPNVFPKSGLKKHNVSDYGSANKKKKNHRFTHKRKIHFEF